MLYKHFWDKKCVIFKDKILKKRRWRCMDVRGYIHRCTVLVVPTPIVFKRWANKKHLYDGVHALVLQEEAQHSRI